MYELDNLTKEELKKEGMTLKRVIEEKKLIKTKLKLLHILKLDEDIIALNKEGLTLSSLGLEDVYLLEGMHLIAPIADKIIPFKANNLTLQTYLIYLSYLYDIDLFAIYKINPAYLWSILSELRISENIKRNIYSLLFASKGKYFSTYIEDLNHSEYRDYLKEDKKMLQRSVKTSF